MSDVMPAPADAYLGALLKYSESFYGVAIKYGIPAGQAANALAHIERAARGLHALAQQPASVAVPRGELQAIVDRYMCSSCNNEEMCCSPSLRVLSALLKEGE